MQSRLHHPYCKQCNLQQELHPQGLLFVDVTTGNNWEQTFFKPFQTLGDLALKRFFLIALKRLQQVGFKQFELLAKGSLTFFKHFFSG